MGTIGAAVGMTLVGTGAPATAQSTNCLSQAAMACKGRGYLRLGYTSFQECYNWQVFYCENGGGPFGPYPSNSLYLKD